MEINPPRLTDPIEAIGEDQRDPASKARRYLGRDWKEEEEEDPTVREKIPKRRLPQAIDAVEEEGSALAQHRLNGMSLREQLALCVLVEGSDVERWLELGVGAVLTPNRVETDALVVTRWEWLDPKPPSPEALERVRELKGEVGRAIGHGMRAQGRSVLLMEPDVDLMAGVQEGGALVLPHLEEGDFRKEIQLHRQGITLRVDQRLFFWIGADEGPEVLDRLIKECSERAIRARALRVLKAKEWLKGRGGGWSEKEMRRLRHEVYRRNLLQLRDGGSFPVEAGQVAVLQLGEGDLDPLGRALARRCEGRVRRYRLRPESLLSTAAEQQLFDRLVGADVVVLAAHGECEEVPNLEELCHRLRAHGKEMAAALFEGAQEPWMGCETVWRSEEATVEAQVAIASRLLKAP